ncbi:hypothetical protein EDD37DRAFT_442434 [Exophiala viscosa]|uniref:NmrA-like domain-containing protein n=1 Tax=Exophiala viscosa TaxID=2486360 RepID=A0AAN6DSI6_9EURO|nr:hypothetical protein EDD36DRAFT_284538 [Exophiala viscosa]KAI1623863.1 hypothetical protein EDD37DRAFT_442434 [Exophiala viscosa]
MDDLKLILVVGGTGAQGLPVVKALSDSGRYNARVLTRNTKSDRAQALAVLPNVTLVQGTQDNQKDLHRAFNGVYGAWVNLDGFVLGEKAELFYGLRAYEIARHEKVQHYIWAAIDYSLKKAGWDEKYHVGHNDAKGRLGDFILAQGQKAMKSSLFTTGPYMDMLFDGMFLPKTQDDGSLLWEAPASDGKIPLIALHDVGAYVLWMFDNVEKTAGMNLEVVTDQVSMQDIADTAALVTGKKAHFQFVPMEGYLPKREPYRNAPANWAVGPDAPKDESAMTWRENFAAWWRYWSEGHGATRDMEFLDKIHPNRIKSLEEWMRKVNYDGRHQSILKDLHDLRNSIA